MATTKKGFTAFIILIVASLVCLQVEAKEANPVRGSLSPEKAVVRPGETLELKLAFSSSETLGPCTLEILLPEGLGLIEGAKSVGLNAVRAGRKYAFPYKIRVDTRKQARILVRLAVKKPKGAVHGKSFVAIVNPAKDPNPPETKKDEKGREKRQRKIKKN